MVTGGTVYGSGLLSWTYLVWELILVGMLHMTPLLHEICTIYPLITNFQAISRRAPSLGLMNMHILLLIRDV